MSNKLRTIQMTLLGSEGKETEIVFFLGARGFF